MVRYEALVVGAEGVVGVIGVNVIVFGETLATEAARLWVGFALGLVVMTNEDRLASLAIAVLSSAFASSELLKALGIDAKCLLRFAVTNRVRKLDGDGSLVGRVRAVAP